MQQQTAAAIRHTLNLTGRERAVITGVSDVDCFNEQLVVLLTDAGQMTVTGEGLHVENLNLKDGQLVIEEEKSYPEQFKCLTEQELKLTELMAAHMSNKEIAARLYLSEGTVKQYINQIYSKLEITGDTRTKRKQLLEQFYTNN